MSAPQSGVLSSLLHAVNVNGVVAYAGIVVTEGSTTVFSSGNSPAVTAAIATLQNKFASAANDGQ